MKKNPIRKYKGVEISQNDRPNTHLKWRVGSGDEPYLKFKRLKECRAFINTSRNRLQQEFENDMAKAK